MLNCQDAILYFLSIFLKLHQNFWCKMVEFQNPNLSNLTSSTLLVAIYSLVSTLLVAINLTSSTLLVAIYSLKLLSFNFSKLTQYSDCCHLVCECPDSLQLFLKAISHFSNEQARYFICILYWQEIGPESFP